jgi:hypothetical protein
MTEIETCEAAITALSRPSAPMPQASCCGRQGIGGVLGSPRGSPLIGSANPHLRSTPSRAD